MTANQDTERERPPMVVEVAPVVDGRPDWSAAQTVVIPARETTGAGRE